MLEKTKKKGGGLHWDIVLLCFINTLGAIFGGPWICAATVRGVAHVSALTVMSTTHAPGEAPHIVEVKGIFDFQNEARHLLSLEIMKLCNFCPKLSSRMV